MCINMILVCLFIIIISYIHFYNIDAMTMYA